MASPVADSYSCASGGTIYAGRTAITGNHRIAIWGQSNAVGRADRTDIAASPLSADTGLAAFDAGTFSRVFIWTGSAFAQLTPASNNGCESGQFGAEFGLAVRWIRETTSGNLYLEKAGGSGASITYFDPIDDWHYNDYKTSHNAGTTWLSNAGISVAAQHWMWLQGEADYTQTQGWYQSALEELIAALASDGITDGKSLLFQIPVGTAQYGSGVAAAKSAISSASPSTVKLVQAANYMKADNLHQNGRGQVQIGYDAFETIFGARHIGT